MKNFFTEWWDIQKKEREMEKAYMKVHWKGVLGLNAALVAVPLVVCKIISMKEKTDKNDMN